MWKNVLVGCDFNDIPVKGKITDEKPSGGTTHIKSGADGGKSYSLLTFRRNRRRQSLGIFSFQFISTSVQLGQEVKLQQTRVVGPNAKAAVEAMQDGDVVLLENTRYRAEETKNGEAFSKSLASLCEVFVNPVLSEPHIRAHLF